MKNPAVSPSSTARSTSSMRHGDRVHGHARGGGRRLVMPTCATSGDVYVTQGITSRLTWPPPRPKNKAFADHQPGVRVGAMGEPVRPTSGVADGEHPRVGRAEPVVDRDPVLIERHARRSPSRAPRRSGLRPMRHEQLVAGDLFGRATSLDRTTRSIAPGERAPRPGHRAGSARRAPPSALDDLGGLGVLARQDARRPERRGPTADPSRAKAWAISQPIGPAPMTTRRRGAAREREDGLVGKVGDLVEAGNRRGSRAGRPSR